MALNPGRTVLMVMVDALRHDYINPTDAPFLSGLAARGASGSLMPSFGFEPDGAYLAGLDPEECDGGAQYWHRPGERVFVLNGIFSLLHRIPSRKWRRQVRQAARALAQLRAPRSHTLLRRMATTSEIPFEILGRFSLPMTKLACDPDFSGSPTVFDRVREVGGRFYFHGFPAHKVRTERVIGRYLAEERGGNAFAFLFFGDLDRLGHYHGPASGERRAMLREIDRALEAIYRHARQNYREVALLVFGDHGMADVHQHVDLRLAVREAALDPSKDTYFLDSTMARFWVANDSRRRRLIEALSRQKGGHVLSDEERARYRIRYPHNYFGDVLFVVDDHGLIHPSFYCADGRPPKGMHGYLPGCRDNESAFVIYDESRPGRGDLGRCDMRRVFPTALDLLGLLPGTEVPHDLKSLFA